MKESHDKLFQFVRRSLKTRDPLGLMKHGAPEDEYDSEAMRIFGLALKSGSASDLKRAIYQGFVDEFGEAMAGTADAYSELAREIYEFAQQHARNG